MEKQKIVLDTKKVTNVVVADINYRDHPDYCDAFIESADYDGETMTEEQLDVINENYDFVYDEVIKRIY